MAAICFEQVDKQYGDTLVITGLELTIKDGEFFTFVGPSGCGKSTVLAMIAGLESVSRGRILFDEMAVEGLSPAARDVAMVFQSYALYPHMTVYENLAFPLRMKKTPRKVIDGEVARIAGLLGLDALLRRKPRQLSGGQRQRVALGRAIIRRPKVFLLDEPLSNLDARLRVEMRAELQRLHRELKITTVYVTHDQAEALGLSERIAVLHDGKIQQCGTPFQLYNSPANLFVGSFIGTPPMNLLTGEVVGFSPLAVACGDKVVFPVTDGVPANRKVVLGIRPDDVSVTVGKGDDSLAGTVVAIEPAGAYNWVELARDGDRFKGRAAHDAGLTVGGTAYGSIPSRRFFVFDAESGKRV